MKAPVGRNRLLARLVLALLPTCAMPLFLFGYVSIKSHYDSLREQSMQSHRTLVTFLGRQLDEEIGFGVHQVHTAAKADVFKTSNVFLIREVLANVREMSSVIHGIAFATSDRKVVASDPPNTEIEGKSLADGFFRVKFDTEGRTFSRLTADDSSYPRFDMVQEVTGFDGQTIGYLYAVLSLKKWTLLSRAILQNHPSLLAALVPVDRGVDPIRLTSEGGSQFWAKIAAIRSAKSLATEQDIAGESHHVMFQDVDHVKTRLVVAQPLAAIYAAPRQVLVTYVGILGGLLVIFGALLVVLARGITGRVREISDAATAIADGQFEARAVVKGADELAYLAHSFNRMGDTLQLSHQRMRVLYKSIMELFACNDADSILRKAVELACTQCQGEAAWFLPEQAGKEVAYADAAVFVGLHGWAWKNHRSVEVDARESTGIWRRVEGDRVFPFMMKNQGSLIGVLKVAYRVAPDEHMISLLHSLISLVEMALLKQEQIRKGAMVSTELGMAEAVQRNIMSENLRVSRSNRIAYHYQPASRLGGDWFYLIEDKRHDLLYVVMGDVTGHGLAQGLVTTAVKGALDVIENLIDTDRIGEAQGPADIVTLLETVVWRVASPVQLNMTCLAAVIDFKTNEIRICNAGHTFPILLRSSDKEHPASHLAKDQQPLLGPGRDHRYLESTYALQDGDMLVVYTDGLSDAKKLNSGVFGRFLYRGLKRAQTFASATELRDEILQMFRYYTQEKRVDDDVCFLVVQIKDENKSRLGQSA